METVTAPSRAETVTVLLPRQAASRAETVAAASRAETVTDGNRDGQPTRRKPRLTETVTVTGSPTSPLKKDHRLYEP